MGGKRLKFPARQKFKPQEKEVEMEEDDVSNEEHKRRVKMLKEMGLIKE